MDPTNGRTIYKGQLYRRIGSKPHIRRDGSETRRDGSETKLAIWESRCAECGEMFKFTSPALAKVFWPNRRCFKHRRPGIVAEDAN